MDTVTSPALGTMGRERPAPELGDAERRIALPPARREGGMSLAGALASRASSREFDPAPLSLQTLSDLLWAANGVNRAGGGRTAPSALNACEIVIVVALPQGAYRYEAEPHALALAERAAYAHVAAGAIAQNVYLYCAANRLATVLRAWIDRDAIARALGLPMSQVVLLSQTVGGPAGARGMP